MYFYRYTKLWGSFHSRSWLACHINTSSRNTLIWWINTSLKAQGGDCLASSIPPLLGLGILAQPTLAPLWQSAPGRASHMAGKAAANPKSHTAAFSTVITLFIPQMDARHSDIFKNIKKKGKKKKINDRDKLISYSFSWRQEDYMIHLHAHFRRCK